MKTVEEDDQSAKAKAGQLVCVVQVQEKLFEEVVEVVGERENVSQEDTTNLPYLDQVTISTIMISPLLRSSMRAPG